MQGRSPQLSMELNRLFLLTSFLLHMEEGRAIPTRLVCDKRLIQKYIRDAKYMENRMGQCQALTTLSYPVVLPLVDFRLQQWKSKSNETKHREILCDLMLLVGAVAGAKDQVTQECGTQQLSQLWQHANDFFQLLQTFSWEVRPPHTSQTTTGHGHAGVGTTAWSPPHPILAPQEGPWEPGCPPHFIEETPIIDIFRTYRQLVQGKLHFFFNDLCKQGQGG
ncbi:thrombopoietin isoform 2-T3 [Porphyrio hochstetteri]